MSTAVERAAEAAAKVSELQAKRAELEASANAHEAQAREDRLAMTKLKDEIGEWVTALRSHQVQAQVDSDRAAAVRAKAEAEKDREAAAAERADAEKLKADLNELLAKAKAKEAAPAA